MNIDQIVYLSVKAVLLDSQGIILKVNEGWKRSADSMGLRLKDYGVSANYLKYCVFPDPQSIEILRGLQQVLSGDTDFFATMYPCGVPDTPSWFLLAAFASSSDSASAAVLHIDVTSFLRNSSAPSGAMIGLGNGAIEQNRADMMSVVRRSIIDAFVSAGPDRFIMDGYSDITEQKKLAKLTDQQLKILGYLGVGATNAQIAKARSISLNAAKSQTAIVIRKLGLENRAQAALFAVRNRIAQPLQESVI